MTPDRTPITKICTPLVQLPYSPRMFLGMCGAGCWLWQWHIKQLEGRRVMRTRRMDDTSSSLTQELPSLFIPSILCLVPRRWIPARAERPPGPRPPMLSSLTRTLHLATHEDGSEQKAAADQPLSPAQDRASQAPSPRVFFGHSVMTLNFIPRVRLRYAYQSPLPVHAGGWVTAR